MTDPEAVKEYRNALKPKCPTCNSTDKAKRGVIEVEWTGGPGRVNLRTTRSSCDDPWHDEAVKEYREVLDKKGRQHDKEHNS